MRQTQKVVGGNKCCVVRALLRILPLFALFLPLVFSPEAWAEPPRPTQDFKAYATEVGDKTYILVDIFSYIAFIMGVVSAALGIQDLRRHVENPQNPLKTGLAKLGFGGMFLSLPFIAGVVAETMMDYSFDPLGFAKLNAYTFIAPTSSGTPTLGDMIKTGLNNAAILVDVAAFLAFIIGVFFVLRGIQLLKAHIENPQSGPVAESIKRLAVGGALLSFPMIAKVVSMTFGSTADALTNTNWNATKGGTGLDGMFVNFISNIANPAFFGIEVFCYIAGVLMVLFAMQRLVRTAQDGPRGPLGFGTIVMFIVAGLLISIPQFLTVLDSSIFFFKGSSSGTALTKVEFMSLSGAIDAAQIQNAKNVFSGILAFMAVIGFLSVVRGLFILKAFADGSQQATMMSVVTHLVAGAIAINLGSFINAVQNSLGLTDVPVTFN